MQLKASELHQRVFDHLFQAIALMGMLHDNELELVAASLENPVHYGYSADKATAKVIADVVRSYKENA